MRNPPPPRAPTEPRESNREIALRRFDDVVRAFTGFAGFAKTTVEAWRRSLVHDTPEELASTLRSMEKHARIERRKRQDERTDAFVELAAVFRLAMTEDAFDGCCPKRHAGALGRGPGPKRDGCARYSSCLAAFVLSHRGAAAAHCPTECASFVPLSRVLPTRRSVHLDQMASLSFGGIARTGIV